ncbi:MAG: YfiR/HmsC family protein [Colwellia sp.]|nr:YfiR/HmsC family protein [Colwellia sp.]
MSFCTYISAEELNREQVKAAFIFKFIKHTQWPDEKNKQQFTLAVYDNKIFFNTLKSILDERIVKGKVIKVVSVITTDQAKTADLLYVSADHNYRLADIAAEIRRTQTLLVSDASKDKNNVMINLLPNNQGSSILFEVNKSNIIYESLTMSAELLLFGGTELEVATLYRENEAAMQQTKQREIALNEKLAIQESQISDSAQRLTQLNSDLLIRNKSLTEQESKFNKLKVAVDAQRLDLIDKEYELRSKETELSSILAELSQAESHLEIQKQAVTDKENKNKEMAISIFQNKQILKKQKIRVDEQVSQLDKKELELVDRNETISEQKTYILVTSVLIIIATVVSILLVVLFKENKRTTLKLGNTLNNLKDTQEQLIQSEKMASLGTLTAGIAHEINTPLGIAVTSTSLALDRTEQIKEKFIDGSLTKTVMNKYLDDIEKSSIMNTKALERVIVLLTSFKQVAADQVVGDPRELNLVDYVEDVMGTLFAELKRNRVNYVYKGVGELTITTIPGAIAQVLTNFVTNSIRHGFEGRDCGNITIEIERAANGCATLIYRDDGIGMGIEILRNIYEPFFTTKRNKGGTGLGMNIVYNIVNKNLAGEINIESAEGNGTTIVLTLPASI